MPLLNLLANQQQESTLTAPGYINGLKPQTDLAMSTDWDLIPNGSGGLTITQGITCDYQDINYRVMTSNPDHILWNVGADLEDLIGLPNNSQTARVGTDNLYQALTFDRRFAVNELNITPVPLGQNQIQYFIGISGSKVRTTAPLFATVVDLTS